MITDSQVLAHNSRLDQSPTGHVSLFVGATSGIGRATLRVLAHQLPSPRIYIVGRSKAKFVTELSQLSQRNPTAHLTFLEYEVGLLEHVEDVCRHVAQREGHLDLLYLSPGYLGFGGPHYTDEGLDTCFVLSLYARMLFVKRLLKLLEAAPRPRVLSVLAGGHERTLFISNGDLGFRKEQAARYTAPHAVEQVTTLHTLAFIHLAVQHPRVSFLHAHPGWVATSFLSTSLGSLGAVGSALSQMVNPLWRVLAVSEEQSGQHQAFHATSGRYPSRDMIRRACFDVEDLATSHATYSGCYLVRPDGQTCDSHGFVRSLEAEAWPAKVWEYMEDLFDEIVAKKKTT